jgi:hypothetical protein
MRNLFWLSCWVTGFEPDHLLKACLLVLVVPDAFVHRATQLVGVPELLEHSRQLVKALLVLEFAMRDVKLGEP